LALSIQWFKKKLANRWSFLFLGKPAFLVRMEVRITRGAVTVAMKQRNNFSVYSDEKPEIDFWDLLGFPRHGKGVAGNTALYPKTFPSAFDNNINDRSRK